MKTKSNMTVKDKEKKLPPISNEQLYEVLANFMDRICKLEEFRERITKILNKL